MTQLDILLKDSSTFLLAELPEVVQQLLHWHMLQAILFTVGFLAVIAVSLWWFKKLLNPHNNLDQDLCIPLSAVIFLSSVIVLINIREVLLIKLAPKVWLIEYVASLKG